MPLLDDVTGIFSLMQNVLYVSATDHMHVLSMLFLLYCTAVLPIVLKLLPSPPLL